MKNCKIYDYISTLRNISAAAYRVLWQFMTARFMWEKTEHGRAPRAAPQA